MKKIFFLMIFLVGFLTAHAQKKINWITMNEALAAQKETPKKILIDFYTDWCGWCKKLDKDIYENETFIQYINANYYAVKFDAEGTERVNYKGRTFSNPGFKEGLRRNTTHQIARYFNVSGYPNTVFLDDTGAVLNQVPGYHKPDDFKMILDFFYTNAYKTQSWTEFTKGKS
jgi:thioredoxin-related protein